MTATEVEERRAAYRGPQTSGVPGDETFDQRVDRMTRLESLTGKSEETITLRERIAFHWSDRVMPPIRRNLYPSYLKMRLRLAVRQWLGISSQARILQECYELQAGLRRDMEEHGKSTATNARALGSVATEIARLEAHLLLQRRYSDPETYKLERLGTKRAPNGSPRHRK